MPTPAAIGFRLHTGWAVMMVVAGSPGKLDVLLRRRIELLPEGNSIPRFVFHKAAELPLTDAARLVARAEAASCEAASRELKKALQELESRVEVAGIPGTAKPVSPSLSVVLRSHPMIHTAEGALFQRAVTTACQECGVKITTAREKEVWTSTARKWRLNEDALRKHIDDLRKALGAPWGTDQKTATAFALLALG